MSYLCPTCKYCEWESDQDERGHFSYPSDCKKGKVEGAVENGFGEIEECPEYKEVEADYEEELEYLEKIGYKEWEEAENADSN